MADGIARLLVDSSGNIVGVLLDDTVYRLQTETKQGPAGDVDDPWPVRLYTAGGNPLSVYTCGECRSLVIHSDPMVRQLRDIKITLQLILQHFQVMNGLTFGENDLEEEE